MLPINYSLRNLARRRLRTLLTIAGVSVVVLLIAFLNAFHRGLVGSLAEAADPRKVYLVSVGAENDPIRSAIDRGQAEAAAIDAPGVFEDANGRYASIEVHQVPMLTIPDDPVNPATGRRPEYTAIVRGITPQAFLLHDRVHIVEGREPRGDFELLVGDLAAARMGVPREALAVGRTVRFEEANWKVVGRFVSPGTPTEAELWVSLEDIMVASRLTDVTVVALRLESPDLVPYVELFTAERRDLELDVQTEQGWYDNLVRLLERIADLVRLLTMLVLIGGIIGCANTLYANALARTAEMAVLQTIGYRHREVIGGLVVESVMLALLAGLAGVAIASAVGSIDLPMPMGAVRFRVSGDDVLVALTAAVTIGVAGVAVPAWRILRQPVVEGLKG